MSGNKIRFDPTPITQLMFGYLTDYMSDIIEVRRTFRKLGGKREWTWDELEVLKDNINVFLAPIGKTLEELEAEAGVKIPR